MARKSVDLIELCNDGRHFAEMRNGVVHIIDSITGGVLALQDNLHKPRLSELDQYEEYTLPTGETILVKGGMPAYMADRIKQYPLNEFLIDIICQKLTEGLSLTAICKEPEMPSYNTLCKWRRQHTWIEEALNRAREDRAEALRDQAVATAMGADEDRIQVDKLQVDTLLKAAGYDNTKYSPKAKIEAHITTPTQIIVSTGIDRTPLVDNQKVALQTESVSQLEEGPRNGRDKGESKDSDQSNSSVSGHSAAVISNVSTR